MLSQEQFESFVLGSPPVASYHRDAIPGFLPAAGAAASVHFEAAQLARASNLVVSKAGQGFLLLTCHTLNLFLGFVGGVMAGRFDVASYLARPAFDAAALLRYVGGNESVALRFFAGERVEASAARMAAVAELRRVEPDMADEVDRIYRDDADAANVLAHVSLTHVDKLVESTGTDSLRPTIGGREDVREAVQMLRLAAYCESLALSAIRSRAAQFGERWDATCVAALDGLTAWSRSQAE